MQPKIKILVVEDNEADADLLCELLATHIDCEIDLVRDGESAVQYLQKDERGGEDAMPDLILLDLNLPKVSGREVLQTIRKNEALHFMPVLVFTSSGAQRDIEDCYSLNANSYVQKPSDLNRLEQFVKILNSYWVEQVSLPSKKWRSLGV